jgi:hypothetical protein
LVNITSSGCPKVYLLLMDQTGLRSGISANDEAKHDTKKGPEEVAIE